MFEVNIMDFYGSMHGWALAYFDYDSILRAKFGCFRNSKYQKDPFSSQSSVFDSGWAKDSENIERQSRKKREKFLLRLQQIRRENDVNSCGFANVHLGMSLYPYEKKKSTYLAQAKNQNGWIDPWNLEALSIFLRTLKLFSLSIAMALKGFQRSIKIGLSTGFKFDWIRRTFGLSSRLCGGCLYVRVAADYFPQSRRPLRSLIDWIRETKTLNNHDSLAEEDSTDGNSLVIQDVKFQSAWMDTKKWSWIYLYWRRSLIRTFKKFDSWNQYREAAMC